MIFLLYNAVIIDHMKKILLRSITYILLILSIGFFTGCQNYKNNTDRPNIIYILADDMGYGDPGCLIPGQKYQLPILTN